MAKSKRCGIKTNYCSNKLYFDLMMKSAVKNIACFTVMWDDGFYWNDDCQWVE